MLRAPPRLAALARSIDERRADEYAERLAGELPRGSAELATATLLCSAYPALAPVFETSPALARSLVAGRYRAARDRAGYRLLIAARLAGRADEARTRLELRRFAREERARIALRELLPSSLGGADVDVTARELAELADVTIEVAFEEALRAMSSRFGPPRTSSGAAGRFVVLGMGKLGGLELNAGSDVDLIYVYDTDDGEAVDERGGRTELHEFWTRVAKRLTATLEEVSEEGFVWRVDLRLRPDGASGALVVSLPAAERYYESFGRLWERAALLRARPVAGDMALGDEVLGVLAPFVWRRRVDPAIATEMVELARRARAELSHDPERDLKLGPGGIRECEFFVQALQLIWGGREPRVRARGTLEALRRLRSVGLVTDREGHEIAEAYLALRRAEHAVQNATGVQTHVWPAAPPDLERLARTLGFDGSAAFVADLGRRTKRAATRFLSLAPDGAPSASPWLEAIAALERGDRDAFAEALARRLGHVAEPSDELGPSEVARELFNLSRHPDGLLGSRSREAFPGLGDTVLDAVADAADPEQAARYLRVFFARIRHPAVYVRLLGDDPHAFRRLAVALGASAFIGDALAQNPELGDVVLFARGVPTPESARAAMLAETSTVTSPEWDSGDPDDALVAAMRSAKARVMIEVGLADLSDEMGTREATRALSALADASLEVATRRASGTPLDQPVIGLAVLAMGKLGGCEIGYGSDLDVIFLFDPTAAPAGADPEVHFARCARRIIRLISMPHPAGPGYELDTRLRPSGSQGLLVTSLDAFARYHGQAALLGAAPGVRSATWERLALLRARPAAGDLALGAEALRVAQATAYETREDPALVAREIHRLRMRMESELGQERPGPRADSTGPRAVSRPPGPRADSTGPRAVSRPPGPRADSTGPRAVSRPPGRHDIKLGRGGLVDVELAVELLQMRHGEDPRVRTTETYEAIEALATAGYLGPDQAEVLREGYAFLRRLEQRIRIVHADTAHLLEDHAPGLLPLARRMNIRDRPHAEGAAELLARYRDVTERIRGTYEALVVSAGGDGAPAG